MIDESDPRLAQLMRDATQFKEHCAKMQFPVPDSAREILRDRLEKIVAGAPDEAGNRARERLRSILGNDAPPGAD